MVVTEYPELLRWWWRDMTRKRVCDPWTDESSVFCLLVWLFFFFLPGKKRTVKLLKEVCKAASWDRATTQVFPKSLTLFLYSGKKREVTRMLPPKQRLQLMFVSSRKLSSNTLTCKVAFPRSCILCLALPPHCASWMQIHSMTSNGCGVGELRWTYKCKHGPCN